MIVQPEINDINAPERADRAMRAICELKLTEGKSAGRTFGQSMPEFQRRIVTKLYGCVDRDGRRRIRTCAIWLPRGCGKSSWAAALALLHLAGPERDQAGQVALTAADRNQASIVFRPAARMVAADPRLSATCRVKHSTKEIEHAKSNSILKAYASESYTAHGASISCLICDELHAWQSNNGRELYMTLTQSQGKRAESLTVIISTAGAGDTSIAWEMWDYSLKVAKSEVDDPSFLPVIFAADDGDDWQNEAIWRRINPSIDAGFRDIEEMRVMARRAASVPAHVAAFKQYYLNMWQQGGAKPWIDIGVYDEAPSRNEIDDLTGRRAFVGLDLGSTADLTGAALVIPDDDGGFDVFARAFCPERGIDRRAEAAKAGFQTTGSLAPGSRVFWLSSAAFRHMAI